MTNLEKFQIEEIEDTLRLVSNMMNAPKRETCLARKVMLCWNWCHDALHDVSSDETSDNGVMYRMRVGQIPGDNNKRLVPNERERKRVCAECLHWEPGDFWGSGSGKHGLLIESKGWCTFKKNKRKRWNYCPACKNFAKQPMTGFIHMGGGGTPVQEDLEIITEKMKELAEDNNKKHLTGYEEDVY